MTRLAYDESMPIVLAHANFGRAGNGGVVARSMAAARDGVRAQGTRCVLFANEVGEGDSGYDDHALFAAAFSPDRGWDVAYGRTKEPIATHGLRRTKRVGRERTMAGVAHQSPARYVADLLVRLRRGGVNLVVLGGHYPAGAKNGTRPARIKALLLTGWRNMRLVHKARIRYHLARGRHVAWGMDVNDRHTKRLHPREVELAHEGPDYIRVVPARGYRVDVLDEGRVSMFIERLHACHWVSVVFKKGGGR